MKLQRCFRKGYNVQHCLLAMIEKWEKIDQGSVFGALLTDASKVFGYIRHDLIIDKLKAYGFEIVIHACFINRKQKVKVNEANSSWNDIIFGITQGSILGPLLFNIHLCDLFYFFIVIRNGKIVWKHRQNRPIFLYNLSSENY